jgi:hypothetical protein
MSQKDRVLDALMSGQELTAKQISARFGAGNPRAVIQNLRFEGFPIYLNERTDSKGRVTRKYRMGTPSKSVVAAGYRAMAQGLV